MQGCITGGGDFLVGVGGVSGNFDRPFIDIASFCNVNEDPAEIAVSRGPKKRAKTDRADAKLLKYSHALIAGRMLLDVQLEDWRAAVISDQDISTCSRRRVHAAK